jgi:hypothetical protein
MVYRSQVDVLLDWIISQVEFPLNSLIAHIGFNSHFTILPLKFPYNPILEIS